MGGHAIHNATRLNAADYRAFAIQMLLHPALDGIEQVDIIDAYRNKPDFGDLDMLVAGDISKVADAFQASLSITERVNNGPVVSLGIQLPQGVFQVDLIKTDEAHFDFARKYFSFNDLGNLIGRIAHKVGFKFGHHGLAYVLRNPKQDNEKIAEIEVSSNFDEALEFLGYSAKDYNEKSMYGFHTLEDVFEFAASSSYFDPDIFPLEARSHQQRVRDRKRPTYMAFLQWIDRHGIKASIENEALSKDDLRLKKRHEAWERFPDFKNAYTQAMDDFLKREAYKERFNGQIVSQITGLEGKGLGVFMRHFKETYSESPNTLEEWLDRATDRQIEIAVMAHFRGAEWLFWRKPLKPEKTLTPCDTDGARGWGRWIC